jgi:hypothetical protein
VPIANPVAVAPCSQIHRAGHAEVSDEGVPAGEEDVLGLHVAMHHTPAVGVVQRARQIVPDAESVR